MFEVGETVYIIENENKGTILEVDDGIAYIELTNGVEMEYKVSDLMSESAFTDKIVDKAETVMTTALSVGYTGYFSALATRKDRGTAVRALQMIEEIYPDILGIIPKEITDPVERINALSAKTGTPVVVWLGGAEDRKMLEMVLRKTMLNTILSGDGSLVADMLLAKCEKVINAYEGKNNV